MDKKRILFLCVHNSARSQMAAALLNRMCGEAFEAESAGTEPSTLNPLAIEVMQELGIDISGNETRQVFDVLKSGQLFAYAITVCDEAAERCSIFPRTKMLHWNFPDPSTFKGSYSERLDQTRAVRDAIAKKIEVWCEVECEVVA
jgi:arsenate reductase (thioredoxin)